MTGETDPIKKDLLKNCIEVRDQTIAEGSRDSVGVHHVPTPILLSGTRILNGEGSMVVICVGSNSAVGKIKELLKEED